MGYTGAALKACKGQSNMMILAPYMERNKMFLCVQDLTCPVAANHLVSLAYVPRGAKQFEGDAQFSSCLAASRWPGQFTLALLHITDGNMDTSHLNGLGIGAV